MVGIIFILWEGKAENTAMNFKTGRLCRVRNSRFHWEELVINAE